MSGFLILLLIYGKKNKQKAKELASDFILIPLSISFAFIMWFMCLVFLFGGISGNDAIGCIIYGIAFPAALVIWAIIVRRKPTQENTTEETVTEDSTNTLDPAHIHTIQDQLDSLMTTPSGEETEQNAPSTEPHIETHEVEIAEQSEEETRPVDTATPSEDDEEALARQLSAEVKRYMYLKEELSKIPVERVKQWHSEGTITEEQYRTIVRKYNSIVREMKDIKDRLALLKSIYNGEFDE